VEIRFRNADVSCLMPVVHPYIPGASGKGHGKDYEISNPDLACCMSAKWQIMMLNILLGDDAKRGKEVIENFTPRFKNKEEYLKSHSKLSGSGDRVFYDESGNITVKK